MSSWLRRVSLCTFMILLYASVSAAADFPSAKRAYEKKDYAAALNEFTPLAQQGTCRTESSAQGRGSARRP